MKYTGRLEGELPSMEVMYMKFEPKMFLVGSPLREPGLVRPCPALCLDCTILAG